MCLQCEVQAEKILDVFPGYSILVSKFGVEGWPVGAFGLVRQNDPDVIWTGGLVALPSDDDFSIESVELCKRHFEIVTAIESNFHCGVYWSYFFVKSCIEAGYVPEEIGTRVVSCFVDYAAKKLAEAGNHG